MKKIVISIIALATAAFSANAQWYAGGSLGFGFESSKGISTASFSIAPEGGYKLSDKCSIGLVFGISTASATSSDEKSGVFTWDLSPYFRCNFVKFGPVALFGEAVATFGTVGSSITVDGNRMSHSPEFAWGIGIQPGLTVDINDKWAFISRIGRLGYVGSKSTGSFQFNVLQNISLGIIRTF